MTNISDPMPAKMWRVLVIDDSPDDRAEVRRLLLRGSERRYDLTEAETGAAGLRAVLEADDVPDCVVLDYNLPDMDALEVLAALASQDGLTACPIVVLTGGVGHAHSREVLQAGAQDYLGKGWMTPESLTRAVENATERWAMSRAMQDQGAALRQTNEQLQMSLSIGRALTFTWDIPNNQVRRLQGFGAFLTATQQGRPETLEEVMAKVHPDDRNAFELRVRQAIEQPGREYRNDYRIVGSDGAVRWISDTGRVTFSTDGKPLRLDGMAIDITNRKLAEEALRVSDHRLQLTLEAVATGVWDWDLASNVVTWSRECYTVHGMNEAEFDGTAAAFDRVIHPDDRSRVWVTVRAAMDGRTKYESEFRIVRPDGEVRWVENTGRAMYDDGGQPEKMIGTITDITERKQAEWTLRTSEEFNRSLMDGSADCVKVLDTDGRLLHMNRPGLGLMEIDDFGPMRGQDWSDFWPAEERKHVETAVATACGGGNYAFQAFCPTAKGTPRWWDVAVSPVRDAPSGPVVRLLCVSRDVTERRRAEEALRDSEARLGGILRHSPAGIVQTDAAGCMTLVNPRWCEMLGDSEVELLGRNILEITHPSVLASTVAAFGRLAAGGPDFQIEMAYRCKDGSVLRAHSTVAALRSPPGEFLGMIFVVLDISERLRSEEELRRLAAKLSEADRRKDVFLATLAHELRGPLAPIRNGLQLMKLPPNKGVALEQVRSMIERQLLQLVRLVDDLLDVSRITQQKMELRKERIDLRAVIDAAVETSRPALEHAGHELTVVVPDGPVFVDGDAARLAQVLSNLLNNSAKYTRRGGHVWLTAGLEDGTAVVSVKDDGIGIPPAMIGRVFEMFTQVDRTLEKTTGGLGIGLSLVKGLMEMHGGTIEAKSDGEGLGSEFVVRLSVVMSVVDEPEPLNGQTREVAPSTLRRILVVDDNVDAAESLGQLLEMLGNEVRIANDGEAGIAAAAQFRPDVVLMDIGMPKLNGYEAARCIRQHPWGQSMLLVALTGWGQEDDQKKSADAGFNHHLVKPVKLDDLTKLMSA